MEGERVVGELAAEGEEADEKAETGDLGEAAQRAGRRIGQQAVAEQPGQEAGHHDRLGHVELRLQEEMHSGEDADA